MYVLRVFVYPVRTGKVVTIGGPLSVKLYELMYDPRHRGRDAQGDPRVLTYVVLGRRCRRVHDRRRDCSIGLYNATYLVL